MRQGPGGRRVLNLSASFIWVSVHIFGASYFSFTPGMFGKG